MKDYTKRYTEEKNLAQNGHFNKTLEMIHSDLSYRRHGSMVNSYDIMTRYSSYRRDGHQGLPADFRPYTIISAHDLNLRLNKVLIPATQERLNMATAKAEISQYLPKALNHVFGSKKISQIMSKHNADDVEDSLDNLEYHFDDYIKSNFAQDHGFGDGSDSAVSFYVKLLKAYKNEDAVLKNVAEAYGNVILAFNTDESKIIQRPDDASLKANEQFYYGLSQKKIHLITTQEKFAYKHNVHFRLAGPKELNNRVVEEIKYTNLVNV